MVVLLWQSTPTQQLPQRQDGLGVEGQLRRRFHSKHLTASHMLHRATDRGGKGVVHTQNRKSLQCVCVGGGEGGQGRVKGSVNCSTAFSNGASLTVLQVKPTWCCNMQKPLLQVLRESTHVHDYTWRYVRTCTRSLLR